MSCFWFAWFYAWHNVVIPEKIISIKILHFKIRNDYYCNFICKFFTWTNWSKLSSTTLLIPPFISVVFFLLDAVPGSPSNIKALPVDRNSIMISWLPPEEPNGEILGYSLYMKTMERGRQFTQDFPLASHVHYYTMGGLNQVRLISNHTAATAKIICGRLILNGKM